MTWCCSRPFCFLFLSKSLFYNFALKLGSSFKVDSSFQAWLTPTRDPFSHPQHIGEDNDDPTVMYFPPSEEIADLSGMVRDTIRLSQSSKAICSKDCENLGPRKWEFGESDHQSVDKQWLPLLKVKQNL
jgi:hypothetical protein